MKTIFLMNGNTIGGYNLYAIILFGIDFFINDVNFILTFIYT